jgi:hypothetical protein
LAACRKKCLPGADFTISKIFWQKNLTNELALVKQSAAGVVCTQIIGHNIYWRRSLVVSSDRPRRLELWVVR